MTYKIEPTNDSAIAVKYMCSFCIRNVSNFIIKNIVQSRMTYICKECITGFREETMYRLLPVILYTKRPKPCKFCLEKTIHAEIHCTLKGRKQVTGYICERCLKEIIMLVVDI